MLSSPNSLNSRCSRQNANSEESSEKCVGDVVEVTKRTVLAQVSPPVIFCVQFADSVDFDRVLFWNDFPAELTESVCEWLRVISEVEGIPQLAVPLQKCSFPSFSEIFIEKSTLGRRTSSTSATL